MTGTVGAKGPCPSVTVSRCAAIRNDFPDLGDDSVAENVPVLGTRAIMAFERCEMGDAPVEAGQCAVTMVLPFRE